jgi:hypothetical protein
VVKDGDTGRLRHATPKKRAHSTAVARRPPRRGRAESRSHWSGARGARLTDDFMSFTVSSSEPTASSYELCVEGAETTARSSLRRPVQARHPADGVSMTTIQRFLSSVGVAVLAGVACAAQAATSRSRAAIRRRRLQRPDAGRAGRRQHRHDARRATLNVYRYVANIWEAAIQSPVTITVSAGWEALRAPPRPRRSAAPAPGRLA